jgi:hypothetical protein
MCGVNDFFALFERQIHCDASDPEPDFGSVSTDSGQRLPIGPNNETIITQSC